MRKIHRDIVGIVIISSDDKVFLVRSNPAYKGSYEGFWVIPGGGIENGETAEKAAVRETMEETGIDISKYEIENVANARKGQTEKTLKATGERVLVDMDFTEFRVVLNDKISDDVAVILSEEHSDYKWLDRSELASLEISPPTFGLLKQLGYIK